MILIAYRHGLRASEVRDPQSNFATGRPPVQAAADSCIEDFDLADVGSGSIGPD